MSPTVRRGISVALLLYGLFDLTHPARGSLMDAVDLAIHETGHLVFNPFGEVIGFAGGTLFQLIMPMAFVVYFWRRGDRWGASVELSWVAQNLGNIATYAADARAQELPLVGGGEHDWAYLLGRAGWLSHDQGIAHGIRVTGVLLLFAATILGFTTASRVPELADGSSD